MRTQSHGDPLSIGDALAPTMPAVAVLVSATVAMTWRVLSSKPSQSPDAWAYLAWGQALLRGERPLYDHALTTPKPLGILLGMLVEPLPPERGFQLAVIALLGVMAAALYWVAFKQAGTGGAVVALACLGLSAVIGGSLKFGLIDGAVAGLVMLAIATRGRRRLACLILAGLARPEAWLLAGVAGYSQATGGIHRRLAFGLFSAAIAPLIWLTADLAFAGDPLASSDRADAVVSIMKGTRPALSSMPRLIEIAAARDIGGFTAAAGLAGVVLLAIRNHRRGSVDPLVTAVLVGWPAVVLVETRDVPLPVSLPLLHDDATPGGLRRDLWRGATRAAAGRRLAGGRLRLDRLCTRGRRAHAARIRRRPTNDRRAHSDQRRPPVRVAGGLRTQCRQPDRCPTGDGVDSEAGGAHPPQPARLCHRPESRPSLRAVVARPAACTTPAKLDRQTNPVGNAGGNTGMRSYGQEVTSTSRHDQMRPSAWRLAWVPSNVSRWLADTWGDAPPVGSGEGPEAQRRAADQPFATTPSTPAATRRRRALIGPSKGLTPMERIGIEPTTFWLQTRCSPN